MSGIGIDAPTVLEHYEALRREATAMTPGGPRGHGLALFLRRGLSGWLAALTALTPPRPLPPPVPAAGPPPPGPRLEPAARTELTTVLAGMVLACAAEGEGQECSARTR
jgi:hypothetical protein